VNLGPLDGFPPYPEPQMAALEALLDGVMARWGIPAAGVIAHSDMAPGRKADPGPKLDWRRLARGGRAVWPAAGRGDGGWVAFAAAAAAIGYGGDQAAVLAAFRLRFRPWASGPLARADVAAVRALAGSCVDRGATPT
jgi:N-acetylmuramoyl-L-alanine amidase